MIMDACLTYDAIQESQTTKNFCNRQRLTIPCGLTRFLSWEGVDEDDMAPMARGFGVEVMAELGHANERKGWTLGIYVCLLTFPLNLGTLLGFSRRLPSGTSPGSQICPAAVSSGAISDDRDPNAYIVGIESIARVEFGYR